MEKRNCAGNRGCESKTLTNVSAFYSLQTKACFKGYFTVLQYPIEESQNRLWNFFKLCTIEGMKPETFKLKPI